MIGISACLKGEITTYKGSHNFVEDVKKINPDYLIAVCPEVSGGLSIPRPPAEIVSKDPLKLINNQGEDVTFEYIEGSKKCLKMFIDNNVKVALLKKNSPSCGNDGIYDGTFSHQLVDGLGVFAYMCEHAGIKVFNEKQIVEFFDYLKNNEIQYTFD